MASPRYLFGSGASDFAIAPPSRHGGFVVSAANLGNGTLWSASTGGTQYTDLQTVNGGATSTVSTDEDGGLVAFYGPPGVDGAWLDFGGGSRAFLGASRGQDAHVAGLISDDASASAVAADSRYTKKAGLSADVAGLLADGSSSAAVADRAAIDSYVGGNSSVLSTRAGLILPASASHADLQAAITTAAAAGKRVQAWGTYTTSNTLVISCDVDLSQLTINYTGTGTAVQIGSAETGHIHRINVRLGKVIYASKPAGASWTAGTVGVEVRNVFRSNIDFVLIQDFETGLSLVGDGSYGGLGGVAYNTFRCGSLANNLVNQSLQLAPGAATPFVNENTYLGGSWSHADGAYPQAGMAQIVIGTTGGGSLNNNRWIGCSLESVRETYILDVYGNDNLWVGCRWETSGHNPPVRWRPTAARNLIVGGYQVNELTNGQVIDTGAVANNIIGTNTVELGTTSDGGVILAAQTGGSTSPLTVMRANWRNLGDTTAANYVVKLAAGGKLRFKNSTDTSDRFSVDYVNRAIALGAGINASASGVYWGTGTPEAAITAPQGATFYNYGAGTTGFGQYIKSSGTGNTGWHAVGFQAFTTAARPAASLAGVGGTYFDTTLNKPGWSDGTNWRDAAGTVI